MTPLSPARRDAEAFAAAVDDPTSTADGRYADLLSCVAVLREQEIPAPRPEFVADLRMQLMDAADTLLLPDGAELAPVVPLVAPQSRRQRRLSVAAAAFVVIGGSAGVAAAAESALPGDALYPIKRGIESAQVSLNSSDSGKGQDLLRQASTRLQEVDSLLAGHESIDKITSTLSAFQHSAASGADLLFVAYQRDGDPQDISRLRTMIGSQLAQLDALAAEAPADSRPEFEAARALLADLDQQASVLCGACGPAGSSVGNSSMPSAISLASLLSPKETAARAEREAAAEQRLAEAADRIAKTVKPPVKSPAPTGTDPKPSAPVDNGGSGIPLPTSDDPLGAVVEGLTNGLTELLGPESPLSETLGTTLDSLTEGLLP